MCIVNNLILYKCIYKCIFIYLFIFMFAPKLLIPVLQVLFSIDCNILLIVLYRLLYCTKLTSLYYDTQAVHFLDDLECVLTQKIKRKRGSSYNHRRSQTLRTPVNNCLGSLLPVDDVGICLLLYESKLA